MISNIMSIVNIDNLIDDCFFLSLLTQEEKTQLDIVVTQRAKDLLLNKKIDPVFYSFIFALSTADVSYIMVGGHAVCKYAARDTIGDLDLWIEDKPENIMKLILMLSNIGFHHRDLRLEHITGRNMVVQLGLPPYRVDLLIGLRSLVFDESASRCEKEIFQEIMVPILDRKDLIVCKMESAREKDILDVELMQRSR